MKYLIAALCLFVPAQAQEDQDDAVIVPESSQERPEHVGVRAHTNHRYRVGPAAGTANPTGKSPSQIRTLYNLGESGGQDIIAIVDAYDCTTALSDFNAFSLKFELPQESPLANPADPAVRLASTNQVLQVIYQGGTQPAYNSGWSQEASLDIEWAHAMAPSAKILLVEAQTNSFADLLAAVDIARNYTDGNGKTVKQISMSWGGSEFAGEAGYDTHFIGGALYFASSGDSGGKTCYPSTSRNVVAVGGTSWVTGKETGWSGSGGGASHYESKPPFQTGVENTGSGRSVPDISSDADPYSGVSVYWSGLWYVFGGTSVSAPCIAGMVNLSGKPYSNSAELLTNIYQNRKSSNFTDIKSGKAGHFSCLTNWDYVTGVGSPWGTGGF